ncbi:MAG: LytTR family transcriptional regulator [Cohaesibacter sp.]|nr:LytTR family transcriptional regulator [Cohaesibacter sp.]
MTTSEPEKKPQMPLALREQQGEQQGCLKQAPLKTSLPQMAMGYILTSALLIWTGPFSTFDLFPTAIRTLYWGLINLAAWILTASCAIGIESLLKKKRQPLSKSMEVLGAFLAGLSSALPLTFIVIKVNTLAYPYSTNPQQGTGLPDFWALFGHIAPLTIIISVLYTLWHHKQKPMSPHDHTQTSQQEQGQAQSGKEQTPPNPFFERLPKHLGQELLWISSQDHYLDVKTTKGKDMILMRLSDAEKELADYPGARIHRSHWVADKAVCATRTIEGRLFVHLSDETTLPVSRTYRRIPSTRGWPTGHKSAP